MNAEQYQAYLAGPKWAEKRNERMRHDGGRCVVCRCSAWRRPIEVHHLHYKNVGNETNADLVTLCHKCHILIHTMPKYDADALAELMNDCTEDFSDDPPSAFERMLAIERRSNDKIACGACDAIVGSGRRFCPDCGYDIRGETVEEGEAPTNSFRPVSELIARYLP